jgi:hypothetical protein
MEIIEEIKGKTGMPYGMICRAMRIPLATLGRWRRRRKENRPLLNRPGPKKVEPFDPSTLEAKIRLLDHGTKRSGGATRLYGRFQDSISRRDLSRMVGQVRPEVTADRRKNLRRIEWLVPGVVWVTDVTEYDLGMAGKIHTRIALIFRPPFVEPARAPSQVSTNIAPTFAFQAAADRFAAHVLFCSLGVHASSFCKEVWTKSARCREYVWLLECV